jgi:hypothetical protein
MKISAFPSQLTQAITELWLLTPIDLSHIAPQQRH